MKVKPEPWTSSCSRKETQQTKKSNYDDNKAKEDFQTTRAEPADEAK
jgi:hypothetical protein